MPSPTSSSATSSVRSTGHVPIDALIFGTKWGGGPGSGFSLTYSFPMVEVSDPSYSPDNEWSSWRALTDTQIVQTRAALQEWSNVANIALSETTETSTNVGDIRFAQFSGSAFEAAHAYLPGRSAAAGDVWLNFDAATNTNPTPGTYGFYTLLHEIGHALGLKHSFFRAALFSLGRRTTPSTR